MGGWVGRGQEGGKKSLTPCAQMTSFGKGGSEQTMAAVI